MTQGQHNRPTRVALIGAGHIAEVHLAVLRRRQDAEVVALCDPAMERARSLAERFGVPAVFASVEELAAARVADTAHVLVPPELHVALARQCLEAGLHTLVEKPMALAAADARALDELARARGLCLAVNHNFTFVPIARRLRADLEAGRLGRLEQVSIVHNVPLRQLLTGDVGHFMFQSEANILFEQGVHLFSLVHDLVGPCRSLEAAVGPKRRLPNGATFYDSWSLLLSCERGTAQVTMGFGRGFEQVSLDALGTDGAVRLDFTRGSYQRLRRTRWLPFFDDVLNAGANGFRLGRRACASLIDFPLTLFGLCAPTDPFMRGMAGSVGDFLDAVRAGRPARAGAPAAAAVLAMCEAAIASAGISQAPWRAPELPEPGPARPGEIAITGGTGFLGQALVPLLLDAGRSVTLLVRRPEILPEWLRDARIRFVRGDATDPDAVERAVAGADAVVHMATCAGGPGGGAGAIEAAMAGAVRGVGEASLRHAVRRMVFLSSTAALYLGGRAPVRGADGPDPQPAARAEYARGKIAAERALSELCSARGLPAVVLRPAIVVGRGGLAEHSGVGLWVRDNHCVGWGRGRVGLPFVLANDIAAAIVLALDADAIAVDGKAFNLAGPVRPTAREYVERLRQATGRDHHFHGQSLLATWLCERSKALVKRLAGRAGAPMTMRDLRSRAFLAPLDCGDAEQALGWRPERDRERFLQDGIDVHAPAGPEASAPDPEAGAVAGAGGAARGTDLRVSSR